MSYKKVLMLFVMFIIFSGEILGAASSSSSLSSLEPAFKYSLSQDKKLQEYLGNKGPMNEILNELVKKNNVAPNAFHRLNFLLSPLCDRHQDITQKMKDDLLCWAMNDTKVTVAFVDLLLKYNADPYCAIRSRSGDNKVLVLNSVLRALCDHDPLMIQKVIKLLSVQESSLQHPLLVMINTKKDIRREISGSFVSKGLDLFKKNLANWRTITGLLGVRKTISKLVYPLLCEHDTASYRRAFDRFVSTDPFVRFAIACEIQHFSACVAYNLLVKHDACDLEHYMESGDMCFRTESVAVARCREKAIEVRGSLNVSARAELHDIAELMKPYLKNNFFESV